MASATAEQRLTTLWERPHTIYGWLATVDHKDLGIRYLFTAFCFLLVGGLEALAMRIQLARADQNFLTPEMYDQIFSMHGITMIFWYAAPILSGFSVYLVPLMIGARDMAFPRLNAFTYWTYLFSGILFICGSSYRPGTPTQDGLVCPLHGCALFTRPGYGFLCPVAIFLSISTTGGASNFIIANYTMRAPGMAISRMPLFLYSTLTISFVILFALPALTVACVFLELDRRWVPIVSISWPEEFQLSGSSSSGFSVILRST